MLWGIFSVIVERHQERKKMSIHAFFYLHDAEPMPENAPDEWFLRPDPTSGLPERVDAFVRQVDVLLNELSTLNTEEEFQFAFYENAKLAFGEDRGAIREFFRMLYLVIFQRDNGPRWGQFVVAVGRDEFIAMLRRNMANPIFR